MIFPTHPVETASTSRADDLAFRALIDVARATAGLDEARVVGGHMVELLTLVYPGVPRIDRRTADADLGVSTEIAAARTAHELLTEAGYESTTGNHYQRAGAQIDILAPSLDARFSSTVLGGRGIDLVPGLTLALTSDPIRVDLGVTFLDGSHERALVRIPCPEIAIILKASATTTRTAPKDYVDLYNLLHIAYGFDETKIGGWRLRSTSPVGARLDCARTLHRLADGARRDRTFTTAEVPREEFSALVRELVARPA